MKLTKIPILLAILAAAICIGVALLYSQKEDSTIVTTKPDSSTQAPNNQGGSESALKKPKIKLDHEVKIVDEKINTYINKDIGVTFNYPSAWGEELTSDTYYGSCPKELDYACTFIHITTATGTKKYSLLTASTRGYAEYLPGRDGYWGDLATLPLQGSLESGCKERSFDCKIGKNKYGISYAITSAIAGYGDTYVWVAIINFPLGDYRGLVLKSGTTETSGEPPQELRMMVGSLRPIK